MRKKFIATVLLLCGILCVVISEIAKSEGYLTPSVGVSYKLKGRQSLSLSIGYELQEYNQLVTYENAMYLTQYVEDISNHALTASIGFTF